jgi:hypothetical protein
MSMQYDPGKIYVQGQNIRPPLGSYFNGQAYTMSLHPDLYSSQRSVLVVKMVLQFQFEDGDGGKWSISEKKDFARNYVGAIHNIWSNQFRITTSSTSLIPALRDVGVIFKLPYYIDGLTTKENFELVVEKYPATADMAISSCSYGKGNAYLDSNDLRAEPKGATMPQRGVVHEFGHMLGLRDEYLNAGDNLNHTGDYDSVMNSGETVRERHYAPFAAWLTEKFAFNAFLTSSEIDYKVNGKTNIMNAML